MRHEKVAIKAIRTDNGSEFKNYTMDEFIQDEGILSSNAPSSPHLETKWCCGKEEPESPIEMARTMLDEYKSPHKLWGEAIATAVHVSNRLFLARCTTQTSYELITGNKPNVQYFCVFGCKGLVKNKRERLGKFETRTIEGIFVGYADDSHAYRFYNKSSGRVEQSCDVEFLEDNGSQEEQVVSCDVGDGDSRSYQGYGDWAYLAM